MSYMPQTDSVAGRVIEFFRVHWDEELEAQDIATKFDCKVGSVPTFLAQAMAHRLVDRKRDTEGDWIYSAGPNLAPANGQMAADTAPPAPPVASTKSAPGRLPPPSDLRIERGVVIPPKGSSTIARYRSVFESMDKGDSFACAPSASRSLLVAANLYGKPLGRVFESRKLNDTTSRIWRTE